jgi:hypothetical protein
MRMGIAAGLHESAGAPVKEIKIEITPTMIEAGVHVYCSGDTEIESPGEIVDRLLRAVFAAGSINVVKGVPSSALWKYR